jgi:hypothetical protein
MGDIYICEVLRFKCMLGHEIFRISRWMAIDRQLCNHSSTHGPSYTATSILQHRSQLEMMVRRDNPGWIHQPVRCLGMSSIFHLLARVKESRYCEWLGLDRSPVSMYVSRV